MTVLWQLKIALAFTSGTLPCMLLSNLLSILALKSFSALLLSKYLLLTEYLHLIPTKLIIFHFLDWHTSCYNPLFSLYTIFSILSKHISFVCLLVCVTWERCFATPGSAQRFFLTLLRSALGKAQGPCVLPGIWTRVTANTAACKENALSLPLPLWPRRDFLIHHFVL